MSDLSQAAVAEALPGRPVRSYPALLSTDAEATGLARAGAPAGALVVADYQASPRGRGGLPWQVRPGTGLGFSLVLRPDLPEEQEGWLYSAVGSALVDVLGPETSWRWPDTVEREQRRVGSYGLATAVEGGRVAWAVLTALVDHAAPPRTRLLADVVRVVEQRCTALADDVLPSLTERCRSLGERLTARMVPVGPAGVVVTGEAVALLPDGALVLLTDGARRVAVLPQHLGSVEPDPVAAGPRAGTGPS